MAFTLQKLEELVALGEDNTRRFKEKITNIDSLAEDMAAFANGQGGILFIGVRDDGELKGLTKEEVRATNQLISKAASHSVCSPLTVWSENIGLGNGNVVIALSVPEGIDKPYLDKNGVVWLKNGADRRRINFREEMRRFFRHNLHVHANEQPSRADVDALDTFLLGDFLQRSAGAALPADREQLLWMLQNMRLATSTGSLTLAGVLLFAQRPELVYPQFVVKGVCFTGTVLYDEKFWDSEDFHGPLSRLFRDALAFIMRNLHKVQGPGGFNMPGLPEVPTSVFEELLVNALVHRDYLVSAPIRVFVFTDRVEIISPGVLPDGLSLKAIQTGASVFRNPVLLFHAARGLLPYRGRGSGIPRALAAWPDISFENDCDKQIFKVTVRRPLTSRALAEQGQQDTVAGEMLAEGAVENRALLRCMSQNPLVTIRELASMLQLSQRAVSSRIARLKKQGLVRRVGPTKGGRWETLEGAGQKCHPES